MENALNNPEILTRSIQEIKQPEKLESDAGSQVVAALNGIKTEEARILEAYRLSVITAEQLARELESLAGRRGVLEKQQIEIAQPIQSDHSVKMSVEDYCNEVRRRLVNLTFETKRNVLRLLVRRIVFEGSQVRISGVIPLAASGGIAGTGVDSLERNPTQARFSITAPMIWDNSAKRAASLANLAKANGVLRFRRLRREEEAA
jgi:hypothetical protein